MKLSCTKDNLLAGLSTVGRIASKNLTLPILGNVLLRAEKSSLVLSATNLEVGVTTRVRGKITDDGAITVQARLLTDYVGLLENDKIELETEGTTLRVVGETSKTTIRGMSADDFPIIPLVPHEGGFKLPVDSFRTSLNQVLFAAAQDATRPEISGVYCSIKGNTLTMAATDSYRLAECSVALQVPHKDIATIIPTRALYELVRIMPADGDIEVFIGETQALFVTDSIELSTRLIEGQYPDYTQIIPATSSIEAHIETETLVKAVKTASLFCRSGINDVTVGIDPVKGVITCTAANSELGEHQGSIPAKITGGPVSVVFNYRYLLEGLSAINTSSVVLGVTDSASPGVLKPEVKSEYLYLIMPIRQ